MEDMEKQHIRKVLKLKDNNERQTVLAIGWAINTLRSRMEWFGLEVGEWGIFVWLIV